MILYHFSYDLAYFVGLFDVGFFRHGVGLTAARLIGGTFIFLAGLSLTLSYGRATGASGQNVFGKYLGRGARVFSYGMVITLVTWIFVPRDMIFFGILHLIGISIILAYPFLKLKLTSVVVGAGCIILGLYLRNFVVESPWLAWIGGRPGFSTLDYWPIFPWFGVALLGVAAGNALYDRNKRTARTTPQPSAVRPLAFLGRHSLAVYLVHQPVLIAALVLLGIAEVT